MTTKPDLTTAAGVLEWIEAPSAHCKHKNCPGQVCFGAADVAAELARAVRVLRVVEGVAYNTDNYGGWGDCCEAKEFLKVADAYNPPADAEPGAGGKGE